MDKLDAILATCPMTGGGVHQWLFRASIKLRELGLSDREIGEHLKRATRVCGRDVDDREIVESVENSRPSRKRGSACPRWPKADLSLIKRVGTEGEGVAGLAKRSGDIPQTTRGVLTTLFDSVFQPDPLLCVAQTQKKVKVLKLSEWSDALLKRGQFIVPSPMTAKRGLTKGAIPHISSRCNGNTGARRFLVVECDFTDEGLLERLEQNQITRKDLCASVILDVADVDPVRFPLAMVVDSAGKSLHGWFDVSGVADELVTRFFRLAVKLGADPATWTRCQLVRLPWGKRAPGGDLQRVLFFNEEVCHG